MRIALALIALCVCAGPLLAGGRPMTVEDLLAVRSVSDPQFSPDGTRVVYVVATVDVAKDKGESQLWLVPAEGGEPRQLTTSPGKNTHPRFMPDGRSIVFVSDRSGSPQVWMLPTDGGEARAITTLPIGVSGPIVSPRGDTIAFTAEVYPETTPEETAKLDEAKSKELSSARIYDHLMIRHWDRWNDGKKSHLFLCDVETGEVRDLTPKLRVNVPPAPFGGSSDYAFAPDGRELVFTAEPLREQAWSTNLDLYTVTVGEDEEPQNLTARNRGADAQPAYSPDGQTLAYVSQERAGFESDQWVLNLLPRGSDTPQALTQKLDRPIQSFTWAPDGQRIYAVIDDQGTAPIVAIDPRGENQPVMRPVEVGDYIKPVIQGGSNSSIQVSPDGGFLIFARHDAAHPAEVFRASSDGSDLKPLTRENEALLKELDLAAAESFSFPGADGETVQGWIVRPPGFDPEMSYPGLLLIHGGPQGAWHDEWHARWNMPLFAAPGYVVIAINPRGSTGFGQLFTDQISGDWGGRVYDDLMLGLDHALSQYPFIDRDRLAAAGGSYGGYMANWVCGHSDRFKALVSHAGVFDLTSKYGTTEELWFPEWEFGGPPWEKPELYRALSPSTYADQFATPTLVIHGALDFRVCDAQGLGMFTSLQRQGVPSRYVWYPDEGHWIGRPANRIVWWREVHDWLARYLKQMPQ